MTNIDTLLIDANLNHKEVSNKIGNPNNWFNDAFNNNEDIRLSSIIKIISVIPEQKSIKLNALFDCKILEITSMMTNLSYEDDNYIKKFILSESEIFTDVIGDWATMNYRGKLKDDEQKAVETIRHLINNNN